MMPTKRVAYPIKTLIRSFKHLPLILPFLTLSFSSSHYSFLPSTSLFLIAKLLVPSLPLTSSNSLPVISPHSPDPPYFPILPLVPTLSLILLPSLISSTFPPLISPITPHYPSLLLISLLQFHLTSPTLLFLLISPNSPVHSLNLLLSLISLTFPPLISPRFPFPRFFYFSNPHFPYFPSPYFPYFPFPNFLFTSSNSSPHITTHFF